MMSPLTPCLAALTAASLCLSLAAVAKDTAEAAPARAASASASAPAAKKADEFPSAMTAQALRIRSQPLAGGGRQLSLPFSQIGQIYHPRPIGRGFFRERLSFDLRTDELVKRATLRLLMMPSATMAGRSDLMVVRLNSETVARIVVPPAPVPAQFEQIIDIDPRLLTDSNELTVQFAEPPSCDRERPFPRAEINGHSTLTLDLQPLPLANDLSVLPAPFFDRRDAIKTAVTLVTSDRPEGTTLQAAGHLASWFGALAGHRGARVKSRADLPASHAIVLATPQDRPEGVTLPPITGATVMLTDHPTRPGSKVLYLMGRDGAELRRAVDALTRGQLPAQGSTAIINALPELAARQPYDAPRWTPTNRPVRFDELVKTNTLGFSGTRPDWMYMATSVPMRLPPDLFAWRERIAPVDVRLTHTPRLPDAAGDRHEDAHLELRLNHREPLWANNLIAGQPRRWYEWVRQKIDGNEKVVREHHAAIRLAVESLGTRSYQSIDIRVRHGDFDEIAECLREAQAENSQGGSADPIWSLPSTIIDGGSTVDLSGAPHFMAMPDLAAFANAAFPFTRMADLSETAIVLPDVPMREEIDAMLGVASHMGQSSGLAGRALEVLRVREIDRVADHELVVIGSAGSQPLFTEWSRAMPFRDLPVAGSRDLPTLPESSRWMEWLHSLWRKPKYPPLPQQTFRSVRAPAVIAGFESPLRESRSVVALIGETPADLTLLTDALTEADQLSLIHGHLVSVKDDTPKGVTAFPADATYTTGDLPWLTSVRWHLSDKPMLLWLVLLGAVLALSLITFVLLQRHAIRRRAGSPV